MATKSHGRHSAYGSKDDEPEDTQDTADKGAEKNAEKSRKEYEKAARDMPIGTVVWYWSAPNAEPQAAMVVGRLETATHCNLVVFGNLGTVTGRQNVQQAKAGDEASGGEYFQESGAAPLAVPEPKEQPATTDSTEQVA